jgi:hypothetical protein
VAALVAATAALGCTSEGGSADRDTAPSSTSTTGSALSDPFPGIWPFTTQAEADAYARSGDELYRDPVRTAREFMRQFIGMTAPVAGEFRAGDPQSGEVEVRPRKNSPFRTTVSVRRTGSGEPVWMVVAAAAERIQLVTPVALDVIASPVLVSGRSSAFEGTVLAQVKEDGMGPGQFIGQEPFIGGSGPELEPFQGRVPFQAPRRGAGAVVVLTESAEDGTVEQASAVRVRFERAAT